MGGTGAAVSAIAASFDVEIYGNRLSGNYNGITGVQQGSARLHPAGPTCSTMFTSTTISSVPPEAVAIRRRGRRQRRRPRRRDITFSRNTNQSVGCE
jgi:hypothetical protein